MTLESIGRYQIIEEIGRGGMATVFRGFDPRFKRDVAIKVMTQELLHDPTIRTRFSREAQTIAALEHPAIVPVYDFGEDKERPYLVMRLMTGGTLTDRLSNGPMSVKETAQILERIGSALERAHKKGIIHRDLKPSNIMFDAYGDAFLADFGIARLVESALTLTGDSVIGTPAYMSPEQIHGDKEIDSRSDIYALGIICFEMLTGERPYQDNTPARIMMKHIIDPVPEIRKVNPNLPPDVDQVIQRTMAKQPDERYSTASELTATLAAIVRQEQINQAKPEREENDEITTSQIDQPESSQSLVFSKAQTISEQNLAKPVPKTPINHDVESAIEEQQSDSSETSFPTKPSKPPDLNVPETQVIQPTFADSGSINAPAKKQEPLVEKPTQRKSKNKLLVIGGVFLGLVVIFIVAALIFLNRNESEEALTESTPIKALTTTSLPQSTPLPEITTEANLSEQAESFMDAFYELVDVEEYDEALAQINQAIELVPDNSWYYHERSWLHTLMGAYDSAIADIDLAIAHDPNSGENFVRKGDIFYDTQDLDLALQNYEEAHSLEPDNPLFQVKVSIAQKDLGDIPEALDGLDRAIALDPGFAYAYGVRAEIARGLGDFDLAINDLNQAIQLESGEVWYYDQLYSIYAWNLNQFEQALEFVNHAIELEPDASWRYGDRAAILRELGDIDGAIHDHELAIEKAPEEVWNYLEKAITLRDYVGDIDGAMAEYDRVLQLAPDNADVHAERGYTLYFFLGDGDGALAEFDQAAKLDPENPHIFNLRAVIFRDIGDLDAALADHDRAISLAPEESWLYFERGVTRRDLAENPEAALSDFSQSIQLDPGNTDAYLARANISAWEFGDYGAALADFEQCKNINPDHYWCYYDEAWVHDDFGDVEGAIQNFERFLELIPFDECPECREEAEVYITENTP